MRVCPVCGETNEDWMDICQRCGNSLVADNSGGLPYDYTKSQSNYDNYVNDYNSYNSYGYNQNDYYGGYDPNYDVQPGTNSGKKPSYNTDLKLILIILLIILLILIVVAFFTVFK